MRRLHQARDSCTFTVSVLWCGRQVTWSTVAKLNYLVTEVEIAVALELLPAATRCLTALRRLHGIRDWLEANKCEASRFCQQAGSRRCRFVDGIPFVGIVRVSVQKDAPG